MSLSSSDLTGVMYAVRNTMKKRNDVGVWAGVSWDTSSNFSGGWEIITIAYDMLGDLWCVGSGGNVGKWDKSNTRWDSQGNLGGWYIEWLAFDGNGTMWAVNNAGEVGLWNGFTWENKGLMGGWAVGMITWDNNGILWCVGKGHVGKWNGTGWDDQTAMDSVEPVMIAFDSSNTPWCVGNQQNLLMWSGSAWTPVGPSPGFAGDWWFRSVMFNLPLTIVSVDFDTVNLSPTYTSNEVDMNNSTFTNSSSTSDSQAITCSVTQSYSSTSSWSDALMSKMSISMKAKIPLVGAVSVQESLEDTYTFGGENTIETSKAYAFQGNLTVPANTRVTTKATLGTGTVSIPFTATVLYNGQTSKRTGTYNVRNSTLLTVTATEAPLS
jgi:hypothetical protein